MKNTPIKPSDARQTFAQWVASLTEFLPEVTIRSYLSPLSSLFALGYSPQCAAAYVQGVTGKAIPGATDPAIDYVIADSLKVWG